MSVNYTLADVVVRIKVGGISRDNIVSVPYTSLSLRVITMLYKEGAIKCFWIRENKIILVELKYNHARPLIKDIKVVSRPGRRVYWTLRKLGLQFNKRCLNAFYVISTPKGLVSSNEALLLKRISGEVLLKIEYF